MLDFGDTECGQMTDDFANCSSLIYTLAAFSISRQEGIRGNNRMILYTEFSTFLFWQRFWRLGLILRELNFIKLITFLLPVVIYICALTSASHMGARRKITFAAITNPLVAMQVSPGSASTVMARSHEEHLI